MLFTLKERLAESQLFFENMKYYDYSILALSFNFSK